MAISLKLIFCILLISFQISFSRVNAKNLSTIIDLNVHNSISNERDPIVYSRCKRTTEKFKLSAKVNVNGKYQNLSRTMGGMDIFDRLPDVRNFFNNFTAPCDLMFKDSKGHEQILYNCSDKSTKQSTCAALDPAVSFDGKQIAFSVFRGSLKHHKVRINARILHPQAKNEKIGNFPLPSMRLNATEAQLYLLDLSTKKITPLPHIPGVYDSGPAFLPNGKLAFTSTRDGHYNTYVSSAPSLGTRIWTMDLNGKNLDIASHHSLSMEQHPFLLRDGRLAYTSWQIFGGRPYRHGNGSVAGFGSIGNMFHIYTQAPDGANNFAFYGQHLKELSSFGENHTSAHFLTQTSDERVWFADYYRSNNHGLGAVIGVMPEPAGQEGMEPLKEAPRNSDTFVPRDVINLAAWAGNYDQVSKPMPGPAFKHPNFKEPLRFVGKLGHPAALRNNGLMISWGKGRCFTYSHGWMFGWKGAREETDIQGCDVGIYQTTKIPSTHPSDLEMIVDSPDWHEIMARSVVPYKAIHNIDQPVTIAQADKLNSHPLLEPGTPYGLLGAASITDRETKPRRGIYFAGMQQFNLQGTDTINYSDDELCGVRILGVMPNRTRRISKEIANITGERVAIIGEISTKNIDKNNQVIIDKNGNPDTSFLVRMPANTPYMLQGIDCEGRTLNTDQSWQALRPGEMKTCGGCHVHSRKSRLEFSQSYASTPEYKIRKIGEGIVPLLTGKKENSVHVSNISAYGMRIDYNKDIVPIFKKRCISCHGGPTPTAGLALDRPGINPPKKNMPASTWWCLVKDHKQSCIPKDNRFETKQGKGKRNWSFMRPQITKYIRAFNSRGSLLYWKAAGERTDNQTDDSYTDLSPVKYRDIDFGKPHSTEITKQELGILSRWIDIGVPAGPKELLDTQKPTLTLSALMKKNKTIELKIGTVDLGSGINTGSLFVCLLHTNEQCTDISGDAELHGISSIILPKNVDFKTAEILVSVLDNSGNKTELKRTIDSIIYNK